ncbi:hypothetical protein HPP92_021028 [Vanilla planifolia]|uniref:Uncharacterized protein n=1 Tax=Vanilla planifolia TaxID=51239 RepID=A0A835PUN8_VANPL|nr:hypothetical protein HPP92_021028 [Vanilla planifolia]
MKQGLFSLYPPLQEPLVGAAQKMHVRKAGGFRLGRSLVRFWRWNFLDCRERGYQRLKPVHRPSTTMRRLSRWAGFLKRQFWWPTMLGCGTVEEEALPPKGHLAVYVCGVEMDRELPPQRYVVPVVFVNHPLFGELLKEAEKGLGFHHLGGITIPCSIFRFELVQARIAAGIGRRSGLRRYRRL